MTTNGMTAAERARHDRLTDPFTAERDLARSRCDETTGIADARRIFGEAVTELRGAITDEETAIAAATAASTFAAEVTGCSPMEQMLAMRRAVEARDAS